MHVPYRGAAPAVNDLLGGHFEMIVLDTPVLLPHIRAGKVKALAVTGLKRIDILPDVPTLDESGLKGYDAVLWLAVVAPAGTPPAIVARMSRELKEVLALPDVIELLKAQGINAESSTPGELRQLIERDIDKWRKLAKATGITMEAK